MFISLCLKNTEVYLRVPVATVMVYRIVEKFGGGKSFAYRPWFTKLKPSKVVLTINNLLVDLLIHQTFFHQRLEKSQFAKLSPWQTSPPYSMQTSNSIVILVYLFSVDIYVYRSSANQCTMYILSWIMIHVFMYVLRDNAETVW